MNLKILLSHLRLRYVLNFCNADVIIFYLFFLYLPFFPPCNYFQRSVQDELERGSHSDILTVAISYIIMFLYIAVALGEVNTCKSMLVSIIIQRYVYLFKFCLLLTHA